MKIFLAAHQTWGVHCLKHLMSAGRDVIGVLTYPDEFELQPGPYHQVWYESVRECARAYGLPLYQPRSLTSAEIGQVLERQRPDVIVNVAMGYRYPKALIALPRLGAINLHGSLLPKYRGITPIASALMDGATAVGVTVHFLTEEFDSGDIILQRSVQVSGDDHAMEIFEKTWNLYPKCLDEALDLLEHDGIKRQPQAFGMASYHPHRERRQEEIVWRASTEDVYNFIRALSFPFRGAFTYLDNRPLIIWRAKRVITPPHRGIPGQIVAVDTNGLRVKTLDSVIEVTSLQFDGAARGDPLECLGSRVLGRQLGYDHLRQSDVDT
jgi:methionyl-tRNA formyltransferase